MDILRHEEWVRVILVQKDSQAWATGVGRGAEGLQDKAGLSGKSQPGRILSAK